MQRTRRSSLFSSSYVAWLLLTSILVGGMVRGCTAHDDPLPQTAVAAEVDPFEALVSRLVDSRWQIMEKKLREEIFHEVSRELAGDDIERASNQQYHLDRRRLQQLSLRNLNTAVNQLRRRVSDVEVSVAALMAQLDAEEAGRRRALTALSANVTASIRRLDTALAGLHDELDNEEATREEETSDLRSDLARREQLVVALQGQVDNLCYPTSNASETPGSEDDMCYLPAAKSATQSIDLRSLVRPRDTILVRPPVRPGLPLIAPITAYTWRGTEFEGVSTDLYERPIYKNVSRDSEDFWKYLVDELLLSRVPVALMGSRGCDSPDTGDRGPGRMCPRLLRNFVAAVQAASAENVIRVGMFDPTGAYRDRVGGQRVDLSNQTNWDFFWSYNIKIFFDTIPRNLWFLYQGQPLVTFWTLRDTFFSNQQGNASALLAWLKDRFFERYGVEPLFILQDSWFTEDSTITPELALGMHGWFTPVHDIATSIFTYRTYNGKKWGVTTPGFRNGEALIGCGTSCREVTRRNGTTLINALEAGKDAAVIMLEGWTDMLEAAGFYRSDSWGYPSQYINIVRRYADPAPQTLRFEAEGADEFFDTTPGNAGDQYALRDLDVGALPNSTGWYVGWVDAGEWIEFRRIRLGCGRYRFTARVATDDAARRIRLVVNGRALSRLVLPATGGPESYALVHLGEFRLRGGVYNIRIFFETAGGLNLDWIFLRRATSRLC